MPRKTPQQKVADLLDTVPQTKNQRAMDSMPELVAAIREFFRLKREKDTRAHVTFAWFYQNKLREVFGGPSYDAARRYVQEVMRINVQTGEELPTP